MPFLIRSQADQLAVIAIRAPFTMEDPVIVGTYLGDLAIRIIDHIGSLGTAVLQVQLHLEHAILIEFRIAARIRGGLCLIGIILSLAQYQVLRLHGQGGSRQKSGK